MVLPGRNDLHGVSAILAVAAGVTYSNHLSKCTNKSVHTGRQYNYGELFSRAARSS